MVSSGLILVHSLPFLIAGREMMPSLASPRWRVISVYVSYHQGGLGTHPVLYGATGQASGVSLCLCSKEKQTGGTSM